MFAVQKEKLRIYLLFTLSATLCVTLGETAETVYGLIGKDVQLDPKVTETLSSITWKKENDKLAEWIRGRTVEYYGRCRTAGRCDLSKTTGVLIMKELNPGDTGKYSVDVNDLSSAKEFLLTVREPVFKPTVTRSCSGTQCTLVCVGQETRFTKYTWKENNEPVKEGNTLVVEKSGDRHKRYTCVFSNPASQEDSDPVSEEDLFPDPPYGVIAGVIIGVIIIISLLIIIGVIYWSRKRLQNEIKELQQKVYKLQSHGDLLPEGKKVEYRAEIKELQLKVNKLHSYEIMKLQLKFNKLLSYGDQTSPEAHLLSCGPGEEVTET